jgi:TonB family protein
MTLQALPSVMVRFFRLRPALSWSLLAFFAMLAFILAFRWDSRPDNADFRDIPLFEMVEFSLAASAPAQAEIDISTQEIETPIDKEEPLEFGSDSDEFSGISEGATPPRPRFTALPRYPRSMRSAGVEGIVVLELGISERGDIVYGRVVRSLGRDFDQTALEWAKTVSFYPALDQSNKPFACRIRLPIKFALDH